jgi:hypothetical protein
MDVLEHWEPDINWDHFDQGDLHARFWKPFTELVMLCHSFKHWDEAAKMARRQRPSAPLYPDTRYGKEKRRKEHKDEIKGHEDHQYGAAYLAAEKLGEMYSLFARGSPFTRERLEWKCYVALECAIESRPYHKRGHYRAGAFETFNSRSELVGDPFLIAQRWRAAVGDPLS